MWQNVVERGRPHITIWRMRIACWMPKATNTHSGCVILIDFPLQECFLIANNGINKKQWLHESASKLRYTYIACLFLYLC
jgi:hypothetical protein